MKRSTLLRSAAILSLLTALGHTVGTFMTVPAEQTELLAAFAVMKGTMVPMPVGSAKSLLLVYDGNNVCTSVFLALCGALLLGVAGSPKSADADRVIRTTGVALACVAAISAVCFFPLPSAFTGIAAVVSWAAAARASSPNSK